MVYIFIYVRHGVCNNLKLITDGVVMPQSFV